MLLFSHLSLVAFLLVFRVFRLEHLVAVCWSSFSYFVGCLVASFGLNDRTRDHHYMTKCLSTFVHERLVSFIATNRNMNGSSVVFVVVVTDQMHSHKTIISQCQQFILHFSRFCQFENFHVACLRIVECTARQMVCYMCSIHLLLNQCARSLFFDVHSFSIPQPTSHRSPHLQNFQYIFDNLFP